MPILFAVAGSALGCFAEGAILPTSLRDFPIPPPRKSIDIYYLPQSPGRILLAYNSDGMVMDIMLCQCVDDFSKVEK